MQRYGGTLPYLKIFDALPPGIRPGHCFPAGHASVALWLPSLAIWWLPGRRKTAATVFALGLLPGLLLGWVQQMRGAHFLSHTLWSVWIACLLIACIARALHLFTHNTICLDLPPEPGGSQPERPAACCTRASTAR